MPSADGVAWGIQPGWLGHLTQPWRQQSPTGARPSRRTRFWNCQMGLLGVLFEPIAKCVARQTEQVRSARDVSRCSHQGLPHQVSLDILQAQAVRREFAEARIVGRDGYRLAYLDGDIFRPDLARSAEDEDALEHVPQFPHIPGPGVGLEEAQRGFGERDRFTLEVTRQSLDEEQGQRADVLTSFSQWRDIDRNDLEPDAELGLTSPTLQVPGCQNGKLCVS